MYGACQRLIPVLSTYDVCVQVVLSRTAHCMYVGDSEDVLSIPDNQTIVGMLDFTLPIGYTSDGQKRHCNSRPHVNPPADQRLRLATGSVIHVTTSVN